MSNLPSRDEASKPLGSNVVSMTKKEAEKAYQEKDNNFKAIIPAPNDPELPSGYQSMNIYRDREGRFVTATLRKEWIDKATGKKRKSTPPYSYGKLKDENGEITEGWYSKGIEINRPPYNLDQIAKRPDATILIVEGEKTADAATERYKNSKVYPDLVVTTSQMGAGNAHHTNWLGLLNRDVIIWQDHDEAGSQYVKELIKLLFDANVNSIRVVNVRDKQGFPDKWDLADNLPVSLNVSKEEEPSFYDEWLQDNRLILKPCKHIIDRYEIISGMLCYYKKLKKKKDENGKELDEYEDANNPIDFKGGKADNITISTGVEIKGRIKTIDQSDYSLIVGFADSDGDYKDITLPLIKVADKKELEKTLMGRGCIVHRVDLLINFLKQQHQGDVKSFTLNDRIGWNKDKDGRTAFVLPSKKVIGEANIFSKEYGNNISFKEKGFAHSWVKEIGQYLGLNDNFCFACSVGFAGILLEPLKIDYGTVFHFQGKSSTGKSTIAKVLASIFGEPIQQIDNWNNTKNGLEGKAEEKNHTVLILDEIEQVQKGEVLGYVAYDIPNGSGKGRMTTSLTTAKTLSWLLYVVSTGEYTLKEKLTEHNQKIKSGQLVRFIDIPVETNTGYRALNYIPDRFYDENKSKKENAKTFISYLNAGIKNNYGKTSQAFIRFIADKINNRDDAYFDCLKEDIKNLVIEWTENIEISEQSSRILQAFAQIAIAGEEATKQGLTGWNVGDAKRSAKNCFDRAIELRGNIAENSEDIIILEKVRDFIQKYGDSRFGILHGSSDENKQDDPTSKISNKVGYYTEQGKDREKEYLVFTGRLSEICGYNEKAVASTLKKYGYLETNDNRLKKQMRVLGQRLWFYPIKQSILSYGDKD